MISGDQHRSGLPLLHMRIWAGEMMNIDTCLIPLTLYSGTIEGVEKWESYKALQKVMRSGRTADVHAVGMAIMKEMAAEKPSLNEEETKENTGINTEVKNETEQKPEEMEQME